MMLDDIDISTLESLDMDIEKDLFLEYLVNCVRNDVASFQIFCSKITTEQKNKLIKELSLLKDDSNAVPNMVAEKERSLNLIVDTQMKHEFEKYRHFDL